MITTRSLLPEWVTASWIELKAQRLESAWLRLSSAVPSAALSF
jgi:hypothetical protein